MRTNCEDLVYNEIKLDKNNLSKGNLMITSDNTFPTAAGCASSASSMAILVKLLVKVFNYKNISNYNKSSVDILIIESSLARLGSGSACRSIYGGIVEWHKSNKDYIEFLGNSYALPIVNENYWSELRVLLLVVSNKEKDTSSTVGMETSVLTSELIKVYMLINL